MTINKVNYANIVNQETDGENAALLVNDQKRAINEVIGVVNSAGPFGTASRVDTGTSPTQVPLNSDLPLFGTAADKDVGTLPTQISLNSDLPNFGTAASKNTGTSAGEVPLNSDLGTASKVDTGILPTQVPLNSDLPDFGTSATRDVGTSTGDVTEVGAGGLLLANLYLTPDNLDTSAIFEIPNKFLRVNKTGYSSHVGVTLNEAAAGAGRLGVFIGSSTTTTPDLSIMKESASGFSIATAWLSNNTTVDGSGFIKSASPIVKLYPDRIELNGYKEIEGCTFDRVDIGHYIIKDAPPLSRDGWYIETLKDRNNNIYFTLDYEELADGLHIKTYEPDYSTGRATNGIPVDIEKGRYVTLRFEENVTK